MLRTLRVKYELKSFNKDGSYSVLEEREDFGYYRDEKDKEKLINKFKRREYTAEYKDGRKESFEISKIF